MNLETSMEPSDEFVAALRTICNCARLSLNEADSAEWDAIHLIEAWIVEQGKGTE
jgi:hypothetical protein